MKSEEKWRSLVENIPDIVMIAGRDGTIQYINHTVSGMTPEQTIGKKLYDYISAEHHEIMRKYLEKVFQTGVGSDYELVGAGPNGKTSWYWSCIGPIKHQGQVVAASIITRDITERKKAEEALKESELRFRRFFDEAADGLVLADVESKKFYIGNKMLCQMLGYSPEEIETIGVINIHPAEDLPYVIDQFERQARREFTLAKDIPVKRKDGSIFYADINTHLIKLAGKRYLMGIFRDVTERKQAEQALRESQRWQIAILNSIPDMAWLKDKQSRYVAANETLCRAFGIKLEDFIGKTDFDISPEDLAKRYQADDQKVIKTGERLRIEEPWATKEDTGERICIETIKTPIRNEKGEIIGTSGIARDITERKKTEEELQVKTSILQNVISNIPYCVFWKDRNSVYLGCNDNFAKLAGIEKPEDIIGKTDYDLPWKKEESDFYTKIDKEVMSKVTPILNIEEPVHKADGKLATILTSKVPMQNEDGEVTGILGIFTDITERKKEEGALRQSEMKYRTLLENLPQKIFFKDKNSVYISCNENYARDMKIKAEEIAGKTDYDFYPRELAEKYRADDKKIIESGENKDIEETYIRDGQERIVHTVKTPVKDERGNAIGVLGVFWDITEQKQTREELDMYREQMTRAERLASLGTLSATVAHELTQPLTVISLAIENSLAELKKISCPNNVIEDLNKGLSEISNANSIVNRFRNFAREFPDKSVRKVDLKVIAERITGLLEESARRAKVTLQVKGMGRLPPIYSNEKELEQLFFALVDNAIQSADGEKNYRLIISGHLRDEHYIELRFSDNCGGIAPENIDRIFEPFFTTRPQGKGTGLGLCIVQRIASRAGGKVRVESKVGEGSTFLVTLPINPH